MALNATSPSPGNTFARHAIGSMILFQVIPEGNKLMDLQMNVSINK